VSVGISLLISLLTRGGHIIPFVGQIKVAWYVLMSQRASPIALMQPVSSVLSWSHTTLRFATERSRRHLLEHLLLGKLSW